MESTQLPAKSDPALPSQPQLTFQQKVRSYLQLFREKLTHRKQGQDLVWWLIETQRAWWKQMIAFCLFLGMFSLFGFTPNQSLIMVVSMFLHELGHALAFKAFGIKYILLYIFPLGAVAAPKSKEENQRSDELPWAKLAVLLLAGPAVNVTLMIVGEVATQSGGDAIRQFTQDVVYINSLLLLLNVIPIWTLDAGQLFKLVYSSLAEKYDRWLSWLMTAAIIVPVLFTLFKVGAFDMGYSVGQLINHFKWIAFGLVFVACTWIMQRKDNPDHANSHQRMTSMQIMGSLAAYFVIVTLGLWLV